MATHSNSCLSSSQASNKFSSVFRQRTRPSLYIYLGVSAAAATLATAIAIHHHHGESDSAQTASEDNIPKSPAKNYLFPKKVSPSSGSTTDETFDLSSGSATILKEKAVGINRVDTILLARYVLAFVSSLSYSKPNSESILLATNPAKTSSLEKQSNSQTHSPTPFLDYTMDMKEF